MLMMKFKPLLTLCCIALLTGCSVFGGPKDDPENWPAERHYQEGKKALKIGDYKGAVEQFENLIARHPFGVYAQQAQLDIAYAYYKYSEPESSIAAADQFIKLYPRHERVDYAYYIKGLARFPEPTLMERWFDLDLAQRNPRETREAFQYFQDLARRYPDSPYAEDAAQRMVYLRNNLARNELYAARFYIRKGAYVAAANRAKFVVEHYDRTPSIPEALAIMAKAYEQLGLTDLANDTQRVSAMNFPVPSSRGKSTPLEDESD